MSRFVRFLHQGRPAWGRVEGPCRPGSVVRLLSGAPWHGAVATGDNAAWEALTLLAPAEPTKLVCAGINYRTHAGEVTDIVAQVPTEPLLFLKPPSSLIGPGEPIRLPRQSAQVEHEGEVVLVIGQRVQHATPEQALAAIFAVTAGNDVTARDLQRSDNQWTRAKGFDTFAPVGPCLVSGLDLEQLTVQTSVNGVRRQHGSLRDLIFAPAELVAYISGIMTLEPGDLIFTGSPSGIGPLVAGDYVTVSIDEVGDLTNPVVAPNAAAL